MFSSQRMLSLCSIGTRVGLIFRLRAAVPLNFCRVQNLMAAKPTQEVSSNIGGVSQAANETGAAAE